MGLALLLVLQLFAGPFQPRDVDEAIDAFRAAASTDDAARRRTALASLVQTYDPRVVPPLFVEYVRQSAERSLHEARLRRLANALDDAGRVLENIRRRGGEQSRWLEGRQQRTIAAIREALAERNTKIAETAPWCEAIASGFQELFSGLGRSKARVALRTLWDEADRSKGPSRRAAAADIIGRVGPDGTASDLQKLLFEVADQRAEIRDELERLAELNVSYERRIQDALKKEIDPESFKAMYLEYEDQRRRLSAERTRDADLTELSDACVKAAARALERTGPAKRERVVNEVARAFRNAPDGARLRSIDILAGTSLAEAWSALLGLLERERDPGVISHLLLQLAGMPRDDPFVVDLVRAKYLTHKSSRVESGAVRALATLRRREAIPILIDRLEDAEGRLRTDIRRALISLTGEDFHTNATLWRRFWEDARATFEVPEEVDVGVDADGAEGGVSFFGIHTESQAILFVLDLSGSMAFSLNADRTPRKGEISRLTAAKRDLKRALGRLEEGARFNLIVYASAASTWRDGIVEMNARTREAVMEYIDGLRAAGDTNLFGGLELAFQVAGVSPGDERVKPRIDTIFLLSDGRPHGGQVTDPDGILTHVRDWNRGAGIVIHAIGLSDQQDAYLLSNLAEDSGGTYAAH